MNELLVLPLLAGLAIATAAGPMGALVVWRRMAFFGDTLAHGALLGAALGIAININLYFAVTLCCLLLALILAAMQQQRIIASDTLLGIVAHTTLALGIIALSLQPDIRIDLFAFLFGDLLAVGQEEVIGLWCGAALIIAAVISCWRWMLSMTVNEELAQVEGVPVVLTRVVLMLMLALLIAGAIRIVGVLLMTSLLVIPAASARRLSQTPEQMAVLSGVLAAAAVISGLAMSWFMDTPVGPSVVCMAAALFILTMLVPLKRKD